MKAKSSRLVEFQPLGRRVRVPEGASLLEAGRQAGLILSATCGGLGSCGSCRVTVTTGIAGAPEASERELLSALELERGVRLACRVHVGDDLKVHVPPAALAGRQRLQTTGKMPRVKIRAAVRRATIEACAPSLSDSRSDLERVCAALNATPPAREWSASTAVVSQLPALARDAGWRLNVYLRDREIVGFARPGQPPLGIAFDLGCTKIAGYLVDLETGRELGVAGVANPQLSYGEDLISRLVFARAREANARLLAEHVRAAMNELGDRLIAGTVAHHEQIADVCVVGNPAMTHLFLGLPIDQLVKAPYVAATSAPVDVPARDVGLTTAPGASVHVLPAIGGWVGADHVAVMLATRLDLADHLMLAVDVGTNTEICLSVPGRALVLTASCPSGPTLEGGHIRDGMRAATGAIERVRMTAEGIATETIGAAPPIGLCGSGIVDAAAVLWRARLFNHRGHLQRGAPGVRRGRDGLEYVLVPARRTGHGRAIVLTQADIGEIQLAKAAICTGITTLLDAAGVRPEEVAEVVLAGAFGSFLDIDSTVAIGLLPSFVNARYLQAGNAAGTGARMALLSMTERARACRLARRARRIDLKSDPQFNRRLARATLFPDTGAPSGTGAKTNADHR